MFGTRQFQPRPHKDGTNTALYRNEHELGGFKPNQKEILVYLTIILLICGLALAALFGERLNNKQYVTASRTTAQERLSLIRSRLEGNLYGDIQLVKGLVSVIATHPHLSQEEFTRAAKPLFDGGTNLLNIGAAPNMVIRLMYPIAGNEKAIGLDYRKTQSQSEMADKARRTGRMVIAGPLQLAQGGTGIIGRIPVFIEDERGKKNFWGLVSAVIDVDRLYRNSGLLDSGMPLNIALRGKDAMGSQGEVFLGSRELFDHDPVLMDITLPNGSWQMAAVPRGGWPMQAENAWRLRLIFLLISLLILVPFFALARALGALGNAQRQIESEKRRLSATLENTPNVAVQWFDRTGRVVYWNHASEKIFGWIAQEAVGKTLDQLMYTPDQARHFVELLEKIAHTDATFPPVDSEIKHRDGSTRTISSTFFSIPGDAEPIFVCMNVDITERKKAEMALLTLNETLAQRVRAETVKNMEQERLLIQQSRLAAMGEMIGNIAHQWRQPINALTLLLANIKDAYDYKELTREYLEKEVEIGQRLIQKMSHTIDDFRNFFKPNKEKQHFHVCDCVEEAIRLVSESFKSHNIDIAFERPGESHSVLGYPNEFAQVVLNALSNAREAIIENKIEGKVSIQIGEGSGKSTIAIRDNGGGIAEKILPKVFDPYFTTKVKGTGIGLYMSKMIMNNMGGDIIIRNAGDGAEVLLTLPLADPAI